MRKRLHVSKKLLLRLFFICGIPCLALFVFLWNSDIPNLILRPKKQKNTVSKTQAISIKNNQDLQHQSDSLLNNICMTYGNIEFITRMQIPIADEFNSFGIPKYETVEYTSVPVPESIKGIAGLDENFTYQDRMKAADALGNKLSSVEQRALLHFLHKRQEDDSLTPLRFNAVKNQVCIALMGQVPANHEFPLHLIALYFEKFRMSRIMRDYCIQFLGQCYDQIDTKENKRAARTTLMKALEEKQDIAAPAIIALDWLSKRPGFNEKEIAKKAYQLASDKDTAFIVKIPALQIAARHKHPKAVALARNLLIHSSKLQSSNHRNLKSSKPIPVILQMSAVAALGDNGGPQDIKLLKKYRKSADIRLRSAAKTALKKLM